MIDRNNAVSGSSTEMAPQVPVVGRKLSSAQMNSAIAKGLATSPLRRQDIQRYDGCWWQEGKGEWIEYTDSAAVATLNARAASITSQQEIALRNAAIRAAAIDAVGPDLDATQPGCA